MKISRWRKNKRTGQTPTYKIGNPCKCGCSPLPFMFIFDGKIGLTVQFETNKEIDAFKSKALILKRILNKPLLGNKR